MERSGMLIRYLCFSPSVALKRVWFKLFSTPTGYQKRQHTESDMHVSYYVMEVHPTDTGVPEQFHVNIKMLLSDV